MTGQGERLDMGVIIGEKRRLSSSLLDPPILRDNRTVDVSSSQIVL